MFTRQEGMSCLEVGSGGQESGGRFCLSWPIHNANIVAHVDIHDGGDTEGIVHETNERRYHFTIKRITRLPVSNEQVTLF